MNIAILIGKAIITVIKIREVSRTFPAINALGHIPIDSRKRLARAGKNMHGNGKINLEIAL